MGIYKHAYRKKFHFTPYLKQEASYFIVHNLLSLHRKYNISTIMNCMLKDYKEHVYILTLVKIIINFTLI